MHPKVLSADAWQVLKKLKKEGLREGWILAGGTGLALQLGHRFSEDLDLFRPEAFDVQQLLEDLSRAGTLLIQSRARSTLHLFLEGLRLSFLECQTPFLFDGISYRGLRIADPRDTAVMKVIAVGGRGSRKDFIDLYFYLNGLGGGLDSLLSLIRRRYRKIDYNEYHLMKSLVFFEDAENEPMPRMIRKVSWDEVKSRITAEVVRLGI